jgi:cytochrome c biogenesis protein CcmG, thiol:disulfide interchange protein DsbE
MALRRRASAEGRASQQFLSRSNWDRVFDLLALCVVAFVVWKIFFAPRALSVARAYPAPRIAYPKLDGGTFHIADERGRVVFLDFYASWCEPCRMEAPLVERYARAHPHVAVVPIDVGEPAAVAAAYSKRAHLQGVVLDPTGSSQGFFQIQGFPTVVVIDPQGRIRATWAGFNPAIALAMAHAQKALQ